jgi:glutamine amidotransferase
MIRGGPPESDAPAFRYRRLHSFRLLRGVTGGAYFYFAHSYAALALDSQATAVCEHGTSFVAALECKNLLAVQFHPEKSGPAGAQVLRNFLEFPR